MAILLAATCFVVWPLQCAHVRTNDHGIFTPLFAAIHGFDKPHNLFPSLHVAFAFILRWTYHRHLKGLPRLLFHAWFVCISLSTVFVHQHHLVDVAGGAILALLCFYLVDGAVLPTAKVRVDRHGLAMAARVIAGSVGCLAVAGWLGGWWWLLLWPATTLALVGAAYLGLGASIFRKRTGGLSWPAKVLLWPWLAPLTWSRRWWWRRDAAGAVPILDGVWLGRLPDEALLRRHGIRGVLDLTSEHDGPRAIDGLTVEHLPMLDLTIPTAGTLNTAVATIERLRGQGPVLVHCALGYGRSAVVVAAWLLATGRASTPDEAIAKVTSARPGARIPQEVLRHLAIASKPSDLVCEHG